MSILTLSNSMLQVLTEGENYLAVAFSLLEIFLILEYTEKVILFRPKQQSKLCFTIN